jgi:tetratricopeptide (TPR) repeat protein
MAAAKRALEIDPNLAEAHAALAYSNLYEWNWGAAYEGFERAIKLNPNYPFAHLWLGHYYFARGDVDRGLQEAQLACDLDPLSEIMQTQKAWLLGGARRHREAIQIFEKVLADHPNYQWALSQHANPAKPGEVVVAYASNLADYYFEPNAPPIGLPALVDPLPAFRAPTIWNIKLNVNDQSAAVLYMGLTPGLGGVFQINFAVPVGTAAPIGPSPSSSIPRATFLRASFALIRNAAMQ